MCEFVSPAESLFSANRGLVGYVLGRLRHRADVRRFGLDDANQEGLVGLLTASREFNPGLGFAFSSFAVPCIYNAIVGAARRFSREPALSLDHLGDLDGEPWQSAAPEAGPGDFLESERLVEALESLPPRYAEVVRLRYYEHARLEDVAEAVGFSRSRAGQVEQRALGRLRELLAAQP